MNKQVLQIEQVEASQIFDKFEGLEKSIEELKTNKKTSQVEYLTRKEVAKIFGVSLVTVNDWSRKGIIQAYKIANRVYYKRVEIDQALTKIGGRK